VVEKEKTKPCLAGALGGARGLGEKKIRKKKKKKKKKHPSTRAHTSSSRPHATHRHIHTRTPGHKKN
jgi:hypothetical protein